MVQHPEPLKTYFKNNQPKVYKRVDGQLEWELISEF